MWHSPRNALYQADRSSPLVLRITPVYKSGFATTQEAYESNVKPLHASLSKLEGILKGKDYLIGDRLTEADM